MSDVRAEGRHTLFPAYSLPAQARRRLQRVVRFQMAAAQPPTPEPLWGKGRGKGALKLHKCPPNQSRISLCTLETPSLPPQQKELRRNPSSQKLLPQRGAGCAPPKLTSRRDLGLSPNAPVKPTPKALTDPNRGRDNSGKALALLVPGRKERWNLDEKSCSSTSPGSWTSLSSPCYLTGHFQS